MGHIIMPAFAFRASLSEDAGTRSGFALTEKDILDHLDPKSDIARQLRSEAVLRLSSDVYADAVGDPSGRSYIACAVNVRPLERRKCRQIKLGADLVMEPGRIACDKFALQFLPSCAKLERDIVKPCRTIIVAVGVHLTDTPIAIGLSEIERSGRAVAGKPACQCLETMRQFLGAAGFDRVALRLGKR